MRVGRRCGCIIIPLFNSFRWYIFKFISFSPLFYTRCHSTHRLVSGELCSVNIKTGSGFLYLLSPCIHITHEQIPILSSTLSFPRLKSASI